MSSVDHIPLTRLFLAILRLLSTHRTNVREDMHQKFYGASDVTIKNFSTRRAKKPAGDTSAPVGTIWYEAISDRFDIQAGAAGGDL